jgi:glycosyltransferase involved in cell wall biosynthesis
MKTKVSIIIPTYNSAKYLPEAIESVLNQTYKDYEIIIVDDGSTDNTKQVLDEYLLSKGFEIEENNDNHCYYTLTAGPYTLIKYFYQENKGPGAARNKGIEEAKGEYIAFLDSDDLWLPEKLEKQMKLFEEEDFALVYCDMSHSVQGEIIYKSYLKERNYHFAGSGDVYKGLLRENFIFTPAVVVKKEVFDTVGLFDESLKICEDYEMWLRIAKEYRIGFIDEPLVIRRRYRTNITENKFLYINSSVMLFRNLLKSNQHTRETKKIIEKELGKRYFGLGYFYWDKGDLQLARRYFLKTMCCRENILKAASYIALSYFSQTLVNAIRRLKNAHL